MVMLLKRSDIKVKQLLKSSLTFSIGHLLFILFCYTFDAITEIFLKGGQQPALTLP